MREKKPEKETEREPAVWTTEEFEYTFSEKVRGQLVEIKDSHIIGFWVLLTILMVVACIHEKRSLGDTCLVVGIVSAMGVLAWTTIKPSRPATAWMKKSLCAMDCDGIYLVSAKGEREFIPWESIVHAERRKLSIGGPGMDVICCYRSLEGKRKLDLTEASMTLKRGRDVNASMFYQVRDDVVTIGYTKSRMKKIREYLRQREEDG